MKTTRRLRKKVRRLQAQKLALLRELFSLQRSCNEAVERMQASMAVVGEHPPTTEAEMAAMHARHHAFMARYRAEQRKGDA